MQDIKIVLEALETQHSALCQRRPYIALQHANALKKLHEAEEEYAQLNGTLVELDLKVDEIGKEIQKIKTANSNNT